MLAAENGALPGGKVGGVGDVLRDLPPALQALGHSASVITPAYGRTPRIAGARQVATLEVSFAGALESVALFRVGSGRGRGPQQWLLEHPLFSLCGVGRIYCDDGPDRPFASDARKFALFCAAVAQALCDGALPLPDIVHLHDWHAASFALLARRDLRFRALAKLPLVYSIHNLAMQGIRPLASDISSLAGWYPQLSPERAIIDPRYGDCYNPVRAALSLCDQLHTVSPTYAREISAPGSPMGEGLQDDLARAAGAGRLHGILNGCDYPDTPPQPLPYTCLLTLARDELLRWIGEESGVRSAHLLALRRVEQWLDEGLERPPRMLTLITRLTDQKVGLLAVAQDDGRSALEHLLAQLEPEERLLVLGNGQPAMERLLSGLQASDPRLLYLCGFSEALSEQLYADGDLFLMPSRFEPCGIAQMLAMRAGQPCLVNRTGGLADTVTDGVNGFVFAGGNDRELSGAMLRRLREALTQLRRHPRKRRAMRSAAAAARFPWEDAAQAYIDKLYLPLVDRT